MNDEGPRFRTFHRSFGTPVGGPIGCLATLILCPIGIVVGLVMLVVSLFRVRRIARSAAGFAGAASPAASPREAALRRLVAAFASDESFTAEDVRQAGTLAAGGATADDLLAEAIERGWIGVTGRGLVVTRRGRDAAGAPPPAADGRLE